MNKSKLTIIILSILLIIALFILGFFLLKDYKTKIIPPKLPEDETTQISFLKKLYSDYLQRHNMDNSTLEFDESVYLNLVTKEKFSQTGIESLNEITKNYNGTERKFVLYSTYNSGILRITLKEYLGPDFSISTHESSCNFTIKYKNKTITYSSDGFETSTFSCPVIEK